MNKITYALALGAGLVLNLTAPTAKAGTMSNTDPVQTLTPTAMSASQFNSLFTPSTSVLTENYAFMNTPNAGVVESQVFRGDANSTQGLYAYAYQFGVNKVNDTSINQLTSVNSASTLFNATPVGTNLTGTGTTYAYVVTNGQVGGINVPQAAPNSVVQIPSSIAWLPSSSTGSLTFQYLNPSTNTGPLGAGALSGTVVILSTQPFTQQYVSLQNPEPQTLYPKAYSPTPGSINQIPAPEPATLLAWAGAIAGLALGHRFRRRRNAHASRGA
jgi:hypothetical protein